MDDREPIIQSTTIHNSAHPVLTSAAGHATQGAAEAPPAGVFGPPELNHPVRSHTHMEASLPPRPRKPRRRWRWHVPPALMHGGESLEGVQVLEEVQGPLGLLLWETYRDVALWAGTAPEERDGLFSAGAAAARRASMDAAGAEPALERGLRG